MIDEATAVQLSRYLDGDLEADEARQLEARLESEPELAAELASLDSLRRTVRSVAAGMEPPGALDAMLEPLRTGEPHGPRRIHPAVRWLGMAAGLALAVTLAMEVARRSPDPHEVIRSPTTAPAPDESDFFQVQPLPTSPVPEGEELVGASDRLLASPPAEPELDEPEPLEVRGPLRVEEKKTAPTGRGVPSTNVRASKQRSSPEEQVRREATAAGKAPAPAALDAASTSKRLRRAVSSVRVVLVGEDGITVAEVDLPGTAPSVDMEVTILGGVIVDVRPTDSDKDDEVSSAPWLGQPVGDVPDGRYRATPADANPADPFVVN